MLILSFLPRNSPCNSCDSEIHSTRLCFISSISSPQPLSCFSNHAPPSSLHFSFYILLTTYDLMTTHYTGDTFLLEPWCIRISRVGSRYQQFLVSLRVQRPLDVTIHAASPPRCILFSSRSLTFFTRVNQNVPRISVYHRSHCND